VLRREAEFPGDRLDAMALPGQDSISTDVLLGQHLGGSKAAIFAQGVKFTSASGGQFYIGGDIVDLYAHQLSQLPSAAPGNLPREVFAPEKQAKQFKLEGKRERSYPRVLKASKNTYPVRKKYAAHLK
jgi:hypothetical protein